MMKTICGLFDDIAWAENAVRELISVGFPREHISLLMQNKSTKSGISSTGSGSLIEGDYVVAGMGMGGAIGGLAGLLVGLGAVTIPALGLVVIAGPLVSTLAGVTLGAATGSIVGGLQELGMSEDTAQHYADEVHQGKILITVKTTEEQTLQVVAILQQHGARNLDTRDEQSEVPNLPNERSLPGRTDIHEGIRDSAHNDDSRR